MIFRCEECKRFLWFRGAYEWRGRKLCRGCLLKALDKELKVLLMDFLEEIIEILTKAAD